MTDPVTVSDDDDDDGSSVDGYDFTDSTSDSYSGSSYVYGSNITDVLSIDGVTIPNFTMGLVNDTSTSSSTTTAPKGVLGIGGIGGSDSLPQRLLDQGVINTTAYSIWVDDDTASSGNLLFGAIDTTKFAGNLARLTSSYSSYEMVIRVVSINGTTKNGGPFPINSTSGDDDDSYSYGSGTSSLGEDDYLFSAIYSPSDPVSILPTDIASQIWDMAGAYYQETVEQALIGCSAASDTTASFFTLQLGGQGPDAPVIAVSMADLVIPVGEYNISEVYSSHVEDLGDDVCLFGVQNGSSYGYSSSSLSTLGSTLLRRTYSVFDLVNTEVAVAPVVFGASGTSNILPFESYGASVPSSTLICSSSYCYESTGSGSGVNGGDGHGSAGDGLPANILSLGALLGLTLGLGLGCLALGFAGILVWRHRRHKKLAAKDGASASTAEAGQPEMSTANSGNAGVPGAVQAAHAPPAEEATKGVDKGKGPEVSPPLPPQSRDGQLESSRAAEAREADGRGRAL